METISSPKACLIIFIITLITNLWVLPLSYRRHRRLCSGFALYEQWDLWLTFLITILKFGFDSAAFILMLLSILRQSYRGECRRILRIEYALTTNLYA